jgi:hypothetical protein
MKALQLEKNKFSAAITLLSIGLLLLIFNSGIQSCSAANLPIVINDGAAFTNSTTVTLTLNASAVLPSVPPEAEMCINNDNLTWTNWEAYADSKTWTLTSGDGLKTVYVSFRLNSTSPQSEAQNSSITLDTLPPSLTLTTAVANGTEINSSSVQVNWTLTDTGSGLNYTEVALDSGTWANIGNQTGYNFTGLTNGNHTLTIKAVDNAVNSQATSINITVNIVSPTPTPTTTPTPTSTTTPTPTPTPTPPPTEGFPIWIIAIVIVAVVAVVAVIILIWKRH